VSYRAHLLLCLATWFMAPVSASALTYVPVPDTLLVDRADAVVRATVVSRSVGDETGRVMTSYEFDIEEVLRGDGLGSRLIVKVLGGIDFAKGLGSRFSVRRNSIPATRRCCSYRQHETEATAYSTSSRALLSSGEAEHGEPTSARDPTASRLPGQTSSPASRVTRRG